MGAALRTDLTRREAVPDCVETVALVRDILARVGDKWTISTVAALAGGPMRFTALHREITGISQRMLTHTLRSLHRDGLITRAAYAEVPPRVEYELTELGCSLAHAVDHLVVWVRNNQDHIVRNRDAFDNGH